MLLLAHFLDGQRGDGLSAIQSVPECGCCDSSEQKNKGNGGRKTEKGCVCVCVCARARVRVCILTDALSSSQSSEPQTCLIEIPD